MKRLVSLAAALAIGLLIASVLLYRDSSRSLATEATRTKTSFHAPERKGMPEQKSDPACAGCHKGAPHSQNPRERAFLNQHAGFMSCGVCHAAGNGLSLSREEDGSRIIARIGGSPLAPPTVSGKVHTLGGAAFAARPGGCRTCHERGSAFFSNARFYDPYRRGLLEDLDVLAAMENSR